MAITNNPLVGTTPAAIYTSTGNSAVTFLSLCNYLPGPVTVTAYLLPDGQAIAPNFLLINQLVLAGTDTFELYHASEKLILADGDQIIVQSSDAASVAAIVSYTGI
jgi:hypothetical protein